jgi:hypothetical protein
MKKNPWIKKKQRNIKNSWGPARRGGGERKYKYDIKKRRGSKMTKHDQPPKGLPPILAVKEELQA